MGAVIAPLADILLAGVDRQHAGSASGIFNASIQLGASIGVAVIGVIFFGLLGSQSGPAATALAPQLRSGLAAAGIPAASAARIQAQFRVCLHDRVPQLPADAGAALRRWPAISSWYQRNDALGVRRCVAKSTWTRPKRW
jgi:hypothetical protein